MADRHADRSRRGPLCPWVAALAHRTGSSVIPAAMVRLEDGRHQLLIGAPLSAAACRQGRHRPILRQWLVQHAAQWAAFEPVPEGLA
jgi:hypothetical protein